MKCWGDFEIEWLEFLTINFHLVDSKNIHAAQFAKTYKFSTTINHNQLDHLDLMRLFNPIDEA